MVEAAGRSLGEANVGESKIGKWVVMTISLVWMAWAVWDQFANIPEGEIEHHSSASVQDRMRDCSGTFKQRYECKDAIVIASGRSTFFNLAERIAIVTVPPMLLAAAFHLLTRRRDDDGPNDELLQQHHRRHHRRRG